MNKEIDDSYKDTIPSTFLKFLPLNDYSLSFLEGNIYFAKLNQVNDPFENAFHLPDELNSSSYNARDFAYKNWQYKNLIFCCSHPETLNNILLWSHYADSHKGFCVEFKSEILKNKHIESSYISYEEELPLLIPSDSEKTAPGDSEGPITGSFYATDHIVYSKHKSWCYEKEYRSIFDLSDLKKSGITDFERVRDNKNKINLGAIYKAPKDFVSAIYLGCKMSDIDKEKVISAAEDFNNCYVNDMKMHPSRYSLETDISTIIGRNQFNEAGKESTEKE